MASKKLVLEAARPSRVVVSFVHPLTTIKFVKALWLRSEASLAVLEAARQRKAVASFVVEIHKPVPLGVWGRTITRLICVTGHQVVIGGITLVIVVLLIKQPMLIQRRSA